MREQKLVRYFGKYKALSVDDIKLISTGFKLKKYKSGAYLSRAGELATDLFFIEEGILKITVPGFEDEELVYCFLEENQLMAFLYSLYDQVPALQNLRAATDCQVMEISRSKLMDLFEKAPDLRMLIDHIAHLSMVDMIHTKNAYLALDSRKGYELLLERQPEIARRVALRDIASYLNITPQSLSRIRGVISGQK